MLWIIILISGSIYTFYLKKSYIARRMDNNKIAINYRLNYVRSRCIQRRFRVGPSDYTQTP